MPLTYVNLPGAGSGTDNDPNRPDIDQTLIDRWGGNQLANSGRWVLRIDGTQAALDTIVNTGGVEELSAEDAAAELNAGAPTTIDSESWWYNP